jgi:predicted dehydrogenase
MLARFVHRSSLSDSRKTISSRKDANVAGSKAVGYAVLGLGSIAEVAVLPAFRKSKKSRVVALVSHDLGRARKMGKKFGVKDCFTYDDYDRCLSHPGVDAVFIASVNGAHAEQTVRAAAAGKHVLCEKPMANSVEDCRRMVEACRTNQVRLMIAYRKYFEPGSVALKKLVSSGKLGRLRHIFSTYTEIVDPIKARHWQLNPQLAGGGSLMDIGIYCVNTMRWLAGSSPLDATAHAWTDDPKRFSGVEDSIAFRLTHPGGLICQGTSSYSAMAASFVQVHGDKGWAALNPAFAFEEERRLFGKIQGRWFEQKFKVIDEFVLELDAFADAIRRRRDPEPDGMEGVRDIATVEAIYRSARENRTVSIEPVLLENALAGA